MPLTLVFRQTPYATTFDMLIFEDHKGMSDTAPFLFNFYNTKAKVNRLFESCGFGHRLEENPNSMFIDHRAMCHPFVMEKGDEAALNQAFDLCKISNKKTPAIDKVHAFFSYNGSWHAVPTRESLNQILQGQMHHALTDYSMKTWCPGFSPVTETADKPVEKYRDTILITKNSDGTFRMLRIDNGDSMSLNGLTIAQSYNTPESVSELFSMPGVAHFIDHNPKLIDVMEEDWQFSFPFNSIAADKMERILQSYTSDKPNPKMRQNHVFYYTQGAWFGVPSMNAWTAIENGQTEGYAITLDSIQGWCKDLTAFCLTYKDYHTGELLLRTNPNRMHTVA